MNVTITLLIFRNVIEEPHIFHLSDVNYWSKLQHSLTKVSYDGATNLSELSNISMIVSNVTCYFLFSDCISTIGNDDPSIFNHLITKPIWIFNTNTSHEQTNHSLINYLVKLSGGKYLSRELILSLYNINHIIKSIHHLPSKYINTDILGHDTNIHHIYPSHSMILTSNTKHFLLVGKTSSSQSAKIRMNFLVSNQLHKKEVTINKVNSFVDNYGLLRRLYAKQMLNELSTFPEKNKKEILDIGMKYSIVSDFTSIMVLETLQQHIEYNICPHKSRTKLYKDYMKYQQDKKNKENIRQEEKNIDLIDLWQQRCEWYDKVITDNDRRSAFKRPSTDNTDRNDLNTAEEHTKIREDYRRNTWESFRSSASGRLANLFNLFRPTRMQPTKVKHQFRESYLREYNRTPMSSAQVPGVQQAVRSLSSWIHNLSSLPVSHQYHNNPTANNTNNIQTIVIQNWDPQTPYMDKIKSTNNLHTAYEIYLSERPAYIKSASFYFDTSSYFFTKAHSSTSIQTSSSSLNDTFNKLHSLLFFINHNN